MGHVAVILASLPVVINADPVDVTGVRLYETFEATTAAFVTLHGRRYGFGRLSTPWAEEGGEPRSEHGDGRPAGRRWPRT